MNDGEKTAITLLNLGVSYGALKKSDKSLECFLESLKIIEDFNRPFVVTKLLSSIGSRYLEKGDYKKALEYNERSIEISEKINDPSGIAFGYTYIGSIYLAMVMDTIRKDPEKRIHINKEVLLNSAVDYLIKASTIANKLNEKSLEVSIWSELSDAYQQLGDHRQALEAFKKAKVIADSSFSIEKQKQIANLDAKRENEVKQKEIEVLTEKNKRQRVMIASTLGGILLLGIIVAIVYILLKNKRRANALLEEKNAIIQSDLEKAKEYILSLLPDRTHDGAVTADWLFIPSTALGGDAFGYNWIDPDHFAFYLMDVCGHGVGPALHAVSVMNILNSRSSIAMDLKNPAAVVSGLNEAFQYEEHGGLFFSIWYGVYKRSEGKLTYVNAGHPAPLFVEENNRVRELGPANVAVGWLPGFRYTSATAEIPPASGIILFSDGVYEVDTTEGQTLLLKDFYHFLRNNHHCSLADFHDRLKEAFHASNFPDDYSMVKIAFR